MGPKSEMPGQMSLDDEQPQAIDQPAENLVTPGVTSQEPQPENLDNAEVMATDVSHEPAELYKQLKESSFKDPFGSKPRETTLYEILEQNLAQGHLALHDTDRERLEDITSIVRNRFGSGKRHEDEHSLARIRALGEAFRTIYLEEIPRAIAQLKNEQNYLNLEAFNPRNSSRNIEIIRILKDLNSEQERRNAAAPKIEMYYKELARELQARAERY